MARPRKAIDEKQVLNLARVGCAVTEIAALVGCSPDTLQRRFAAVIKEGFEHRNASLRRKQFEAAMKGNTTMLIWLGKQYLGQRDKQEMSGPDGARHSISIQFVDPLTTRLLAGRQRVAQESERRKAELTEGREGGYPGITPKLTRDPGAS